MHFGKSVFSQLMMFMPELEFKKCVARLMNTINDFIEISKIESGEAKIVLSDFNCEDLMNYQHGF
jgi:signal transduction histidine kinase